MHSLVTSGAEQIPEGREHRHVSEGWGLGRYLKRVPDGVFGKRGKETCKLVHLYGFVRILSF